MTPVSNPCSAEDPHQPSLSKGQTHNPIMELANRFFNSDNLQLSLSPPPQPNQSVEALCNAASTGDSTKIQELIAKGTPINDINSQGMNPLQSALINGQLEALILLKNAGADLSQITLNNERNILHLAALYGHENIVFYLLENGFEINQLDKAGYTPLHHAVVKKQKKVVEILLYRNADPNLAINLFGTSPLHTASATGHIAMIKLLIKNGADVNVTDNGQCTPLHEAVEKGYLEAIKTLLANGANPNAANIYGKTPLHKAAETDNLEIIKELINGKANVNAMDQEKHTPLHATQNPKTQKLLKCFGAVKDPIKFIEITKAHVYAHLGQVDELQKLTPKQLNVQDKRGRTPLHCAILATQIETAKKLIELGADSSLADENGTTPNDLLADLARTSFTFTGAAKRPRLD